jgi:hypothetical protein
VEDVDEGLARPTRSSVGDASKSGGASSGLPGAWQHKETPFLLTAMTRSQSFADSSFDASDGDDAGILDRYVNFSELRYGSIA